MTIYPADHAVYWRKDIPKRPGSQSGTLAAPWHRFDEFPCVHWDGEECAAKVLPECIAPPDRQTASVRDAWTRERQVAHA